MHISETSIEFGSQSKQKQNIKTQTNKEKKPKQNVKNKNKTKIIIHTVTYRRIVKMWKKYIVTFCPVIFFLPTQHIFTILY